ncbi:MAG: type IX secretion system sortase PorU [Muribaculaceae bacterium]|nr:type IX secretion system sortase PorU [Muribaculaceae bacterium]
MNKRLLFNVFCVIILAVAGVGTVKAFNANIYASQSKLSNGKWVKIAIPEDGMYEISFNELHQMGFRNPQNVNLYGTGGHPISEILNGNAIDDLKQVPCKIYGDKLCFYACGAIEYTIDTPVDNPHFTRKFNNCSTMGYYFLCENNETHLQPTTITYGITGTNVRNTSLDYFHHEQEVISASQSGKEFLGEKITDQPVTISYSMPKLCGDSAIIVNPRAAAKNKNSFSYITLKVNENDIALSTQESKIYTASSEYVFYNTAQPLVTVRGENGSNIPENGEITIGVTSSQPFNWARLDYCLITYYHSNNLRGTQNNQMRMGFNNVSSADIISIVGATTSTQLWNIDNPLEPKNYSISEKNGIKGFTPLYTIDYTQFIAFDPTKELKKIAGFEQVANQNIHGMPLPDMIIVTCEPLMQQAERVAQMHRDNDRMVVHVLDQQKIFNEFSSGTPDPMAIRLMNKMFYDRDGKNKFKYLLMFGGGSYDNRQLLVKNPCNIITYESPVSNDENNSFVSDDFFGFLDDNSGVNPAGDLLRLGVGRIPSSSVEEAETDVDKLLNYVNNPDYGPWRNNALFIADYVYDVPGTPPNTETYMHESQAEGVANLICDELSAGFMKNKVYVNQFPKDPATGFSLEGRKSMNSLLESGQFFMTYVGHANPSALTKQVNLWTTNESKHASYPHLPIVTTACCDVARYDGSQRGLMEIMFHRPDGGAIAMLAATRSAYATGNDALNKAFVTNLFSYNNTGQMTTLGEAYMLCKQSFGTVTAYNKMMFSLLGDPAMKVYYPKPLFKITKINGYNVGTSNITSGALRQVTVVATVLKENGALDSSFNGDATLSIYDYMKKETTYNGRDIYYPRKMLTQVNGRVVNGVFTGKAVIPRYTQNPGNQGLVSVYAHRDNSNDMVNGSFDKLVISSYTASNALTVHDSIAPTIDAIYFNDEQYFELCNTVDPSSTLHIIASDDVAFNTQSMAIGNSMDLKIDGGKTNLPNVSAYAAMSNEGKTLTVEMPLQLEPGDHTLQYSVYDIAGNMTTSYLNFAVSSTQQAKLTVDQEPAIDKATFNFKSDLSFTPNVEIKLFDHLGNMKWHKTISNFPFDWNLKIGNNRLPPGIYTFYGKYNNGTIYGSTPIGTLVVAEEYQMQ